MPHAGGVPALRVLARHGHHGEDNPPARSLTLMAGPVDCRINGVNELANSKPIEWFGKT
jgi:poly(3-hydroxybutyrate) depolymerase